MSFHSADWDWYSHCDVLVIGAGVAGLSAAQRSRELGADVLLIDKGTWRAGARPYPRFRRAATNLAQGGLAVVGLSDAPCGPGGHDSVASHVSDTIAAGAGHCDPAAVHTILSNAALAVQWLIDHGADFDRVESGPYARTREGAHSHRRIIHAGGDATGAEIQRALERSVGGIRLLQNASAVEILRADGHCAGVVVRDPRGPGLVSTNKVVIATGGLGHLWQVTTAPTGALGDGHMLAADAGAELADLEFIQFHPTVLFDAKAQGRRPLLTEALRGEGAHLVDCTGDDIMNTVDPRGDLAPRDIVSRAIAARMHQTDTDHVYLDARMIRGIHQRFPTVTQGCQSMGLDPAKHLLPVAPAVHYSCGGIVTDTVGHTRVPGIYAVGECARTGLHGANRLASNSLLEGLVVGKAAAEDIAAGSGHWPEVSAPAAANTVAWPQRPRGLQRPQLGDKDRLAMQAAMTVGAGVMRTHDSLSAAAAELDKLPDSGPVTVARSVVAAALARTQTLGCHTRTDDKDN
ncbi:L-aspartate oxidase [Corynebacterium sp. TAE3-ERU12]|uniref:L-aspartate oxidase n=1 Tax=Corynebacterium sp. TAE3-ERU12 TaxID=2849491 RepID=UPI001C45A6FE|nr:L-aspartate oxidase [Corynebacterium sp. TAE3-ERU12]MBV7296184.1 L-aspartate oxidase [Corynebacterium sp. TAE3-ERU12]